MEKKVKPRSLNKSIKKERALRRSLKKNPV
jgi:hypothetical protein